MWSYVSWRRCGGRNFTHNVHFLSSLEASNVRPVVLLVAEAQLWNLKSQLADYKYIYLYIYMVFDVPGFWSQTMFILPSHMAMGHKPQTPVVQTADGASLFRSDCWPPAVFSERRHEMRRFHAVHPEIMALDRYFNWKNEESLGIAGQSHISAGISIHSWTLMLNQFIFWWMVPSEILRTTICQPASW